jgi:hypothetical protein
MIAPNWILDIIYLPNIINRGQISSLLICALNVHPSILFSTSKLYYMEWTDVST